jgi:hypothetical protein
MPKAGSGKASRGIDFFAVPFGESMLFRIASAHEIATHYRMSPPEFWPVGEMLSRIDTIDKVRYSRSFFCEP